MPTLAKCGWDYCNQTIDKLYGPRCPEHRDMKWHEEYKEHLKHLCWEEEELPLDDFEDALDIVDDAREAGGPTEAIARLQSEHGLNPDVFDTRFREAERSLLSGGERA